MSQEEPGFLKLASSCRVDAALFWVVSACHAESTANYAKAFSSMATHYTELSEAIGEGSKREKTGNRHSKKPPSTHILCGQNNYNNNKTELSDCRWEYRTATASCELVGFHLSGWGRENVLKRKWLVVSMGALGGGGGGAGHCGEAFSCWQLQSGVFSKLLRASEKSLGLCFFAKPSYMGVGSLASTRPLRGPAPLWPHKGV